MNNCKPNFAHPENYSNIILFIADVLKSFIECAW
jgi:hypothetical protein